MIRAALLVDFAGDPEREYPEMEQLVREALSEPVEFEREIWPWKLSGQELYVIDFGGLLPGADDTVNSILDSLRERSEEMPGTLFVLWSRFTMTKYCDLIRKEADRMGLISANVVTAHDGTDPIARWFAQQAPARKAGRK